jgi:hypothetical protein
MNTFRVFNITARKVVSQHRSLSAALTAFRKIRLRRVASSYHSRIEVRKPSGFAQGAFEWVGLDHTAAAQELIARNKQLRLSLGEERLDEIHIDGSAPTEAERVALAEIASNRATIQVLAAL